MLGHALAHREHADEVITEAVRFADQSPEPALDSLYDHLYVDGETMGWYAVDERTPEVHRGEDEHEIGAHGVAQELAEAGAAYAGAGDVQKRRRQQAGPADEAQHDEDREDDES